MKFRQFELRDDINQAEYVAFRVGVEDRKPSAWERIEQIPEELFYDVLVRAALSAGWIADIVENNEYDEEVVWVWKESGMEYLDNLPAGKAPLRKWGMPIFDRWLEYKTLDPN